MHPLPSPLPCPLPPGQMRVCAPPPPGPRSVGSEATKVCFLWKPMLRLWHLRSPPDSSSKLPHEGPTLLRPQKPSQLGQILELASRVWRGQL